MNRTRILYAIATATIALCITNLTYLIVTAPSPQIVNLTWQEPNSTIIKDEETGEDILVYNYMVGIIPRYNPQTGEIKITSTTGLKEEMKQELQNNSVTIYFENITQHNGTVIWPIWNESNNKTTYYVLKTRYSEGIWRGATIASPNGTIKTYNHSLNDYQEFQQITAKMLPKVEFKIEGQRNPLAAVIPIGGMLVASITIIYAKAKENA